VAVPPTTLEYTKSVKPVVVNVIARVSKRAVGPAPESMFVTTAGTVGNVNPKFTTVVKLPDDVKLTSTVP
jgi:hypothetical protein